MVQVGKSFRLPDGHVVSLDWLCPRQFVPLRLASSDEAAAYPIADAQMNWLSATYDVVNHALLAIL